MEAVRLPLEPEGGYPLRLDSLRGSDEAKDRLTIARQRRLWLRLHLGPAAPVNR